jgi:hypothetical protein
MVCVFVSTCWALGSDIPGRGRRWLIAVGFYLFLVGMCWGLFVLASGLFSLLAWGVIVLVSAELLFILDKKYPEKKLRFWELIKFTAERKLSRLGIIIFCLFPLIGLFDVFKKLFNLMKVNIVAVGRVLAWLWEGLISFGLLICVIATICLIILVYLAINSLKYKIVKKK